MQKVVKRSWVLSFTLALAMTHLVATRGATAAPSGDPHADLVKASLIADAEAVVPGRSFTLGVKLKIKPHWHTYWINPGDFGEATQVQLRGPAGFEFGEIQWPLPSRIALDSGVTYGYEDEVMLLIPVKVAADAPAGGKAAIEADVSWLVCKEECLQGEAKLSLTLPISAETPNPGAAAHAAEFAAWRQRLPVTMKDSAARAALAHVEQAMTADRQPAPGLTIHWKQPPRNVQWFPIATQAVAVSDVTVRHDGPRTEITFAPTIYQADEIPGGVMQSVVVYEDAQGRRHGVAVPVRVNLAE